MKTFVINAVILTLILSVILIFSKPLKNYLSKLSIIPVSKETSQVELIKKLENNFAKFQEQIPIRPVLGTDKWIGPILVQYISNNRMLISFEDGHVIGIAIVEYVPMSRSFLLIKMLTDSEYQYSQINWESIVSKYGQPGFRPINYAKSMSRAGETIAYPDWTKISENIFVK
jgi:hypothetical protein